MLYSSASFLYYFLPILLIVYFAVPGRLRNLVLLLASLAFYFYGEQVYLAILLLNAISGYFHGLWIGKAREAGRAMVPLISALAVSLGLLILMKYSGLISTNINSLFRSDTALFKIIVPLGIGIYTLQVIGYSLDVYRGHAKAQRNFLDFALYASLFPQMIAGPVVRYTHVQSALSQRSHSFACFAQGVSRFILGLAKKVLLANTLAELSYRFASAEGTVLFYWLAALAFLLRIYYDLSGYSDMAIGLGRIFGFSFPENFKYPFIAKSITEFWERWLISLGSWLKEYVKIPLPATANILFMGLLMGLWHSAEWNFILWGLVFAGIIAAERLFLGRLLAGLPRLLRHLYVLLLLLLGFVFFSAGSIRGGLAYFGGMFGLLDIPFSSAETYLLLRSYAITIIIAAIGATPWPASVLKGIRTGRTGEKLLNLLEPVVLVALFLLCTGYITDGLFNPFGFFRF